MIGDGWLDEGGGGGVVNVSARSLRIKANTTLFHSMKCATCFYNISLNFLPYLFMPRAVSRMS